jgi:ABC-type dipeptide/oligopeptide/nickel transport system permease component
VGAYILRRLLLILPTLFGIMVINFLLVQFVPGGPVEQVIAQMQGEGDVFGGFAGGAEDATLNEGEGEGYAGARGLPPEFIDELEAQYGLDKPPLQRFLDMMWNYMQFDFGESYFRSISVTDLVLEKMPVSITLGLWSTVIAYLISIPLGIRKAVNDGTRFDSWTSGVIIAAYAILLVGAASPGPAVAMLVGIATEQGRGPSLMAAFGIAVGSMTLNILTLLGVGLLLSQAAWAMSALRVLGAAYLVYLAYGALRKALRPPALNPANMAARAP